VSEQVEIPRVPDKVTRKKLQLFGFDSAAGDLDLPRAVEPKVSRAR
jgi:hypothetical protein